MKKISLILFAWIFAVAAIAQDNNEPLTGKKGQRILPDAGDIGLGFNMIPFLNWFGNSFNNNSSNTYASANKFFNNFGSTVIAGKYMLSETSALRVNFGMDFNHSTDTRFVFDDASNDPADKVVDIHTIDNGNFALGVGYEMRRGKGRIQGFWGADIAFSISNLKNSYQYGNGMTSTNAIPTSTNFNSNNSNINGNERTIQTAPSTRFGVGLRPFIGVEYFVAPRISLGGEFGYTLRYVHTFRAKEITEYYEAASNSVVNIENEVAAENSFNGNIDNFSGAVFMMFYF